MQLRPTPPKCLVCEPVKPIPEYSLVYTITAGKGVFAGHARQRGKERGVESCNLRNIGPRDIARGFDPLDCFGLCSGASSDSAWMAADTLESILTGAVKRLPP